MITENKNHDKDRTFRGLKNEVPQNHGLGEEYENREIEEQLRGGQDEPVNNGGTDITNLDPMLEEQWMAVRDEYLSHYPDLKDIDAVYEKGSFKTLLNSLAERRQRTPEEIHQEIMGWRST